MSLSSMTLELRRSFDYVLTDYWQEAGDKRCQDYPLMYSLGPALSILLAYLAFVLYIGPRFMANRKPYKLTKILLVYNFAMSATNLFYFCWILANYSYGKDIFDVRFPSLTDNDSKTQNKIFFHYVYWVTKLIDLCDTIFFVLRKKQNQITGLHVYHHFSVPLLGWLYFRINTVANMMVAFGLVNTFVHFLMYAYYGLAALGPRIQKWLWWKQYITQLQILQFVFLLGYAIYFWIFQRDWPMVLIFNNVLQACLYLVLFTKFYISSYSSKKRSMASEKEMNNNNNVAKKVQ